MVPAPVAILVPVLRRPHRVAPLVDNVAGVTPWPYRVVFVVSEDDDEEIAACEAEHDGDPEHVEVLGAPWPGGSAGDYARKLNAAVEATVEPLIFQGADDLLFHSGWLEEACRLLGPGIGVVGTNDLFNPRVRAGKHSTHSLITRAYVTDHGTIDEPGKLMHEGYPHEFTDDELVQTAMHRRAYKHAHDSIVEHLHPYAGKAEQDDVYELGHARNREGQRLYQSRARLWQGRPMTSTQFRGEGRQAVAPAPSPLMAREPSIAVIVATYGSDRWKRLGKQAGQSAQVQLRPNDRLLVMHEATTDLHIARNRAADLVGAECEWLVFLDGDDALAPGYLDAMRAAAPGHGTDALLVPGIADGRRRRRVETRPMTEINRAVIGTAIRRRLFGELGGFRDWPVYEDWDLWLRALKAGAQMIDVPDAVYRVGRSVGRGRNTPARHEAVRVYDAIRADLGIG